MSAPPMSASERVLTTPRHGYPLTLRLPEQTVVLWWGTDPQGIAGVGVDADQRVLTWDSIERCEQAALDRGFTVASTAGSAPLLMDLGPVAEWLDGKRATLDPVAALDLWNLAGDVALSVGVPWEDSGRIADACHAKLTLANVPWIAHVSTYTPHWDTHELRYLRRRLAAALALLRRTLP